MVTATPDIGTDRMGWGHRTVAVFAALLMALPFAATASAAPEDRSTVEHAIQWLVGQFNDGNVTGGGGLSDLIWALEAYDVADDVQAAALEELETSATGYIGAPGSTDPGRLAKLALAVALGGGDVNDFAGRDLEAELRATITAEGQFGSGSMFIHPFGMMVLAMTDGGVPENTVQWAIDQQEASGMFGGADTTALVVQGLFAVAEHPTMGDAASQAAQSGAEALVAAQRSSGAWSSWGSENTNSTGLAVQAVRAAGFTVEAGKGAEYIRNVQYTTGEKSGAIPWQPGVDGSLFMATVQAVMAFGAPRMDLMATPSGPCEGNEGVTVTVDLSAFDEGVVEGCALGDPEDGMEALRAADFDVTESWPGFVCQIEGLPSEGVSCDTSKNDYVGTFWGYYHKTSADWEFSQVGAANYDPVPGNSEGWRYGNGGPTAPMVVGDASGSVCDAGQGVTVVVDLTAFGQGVQIGCAEGTPATAIEAAAAAGFTPTTLGAGSDESVCRLLDYPPVPTADNYVQDVCAEATPWNGLEWTFSTATTGQPWATGGSITDSPAGDSFIAWRYSDGDVPSIAADDLKFAPPAVDCGDVARLAAWLDNEISGDDGAGFYGTPDLVETAMGRLAIAGGLDQHRDHLYDALLHDNNFDDSTYWDDWMGEDVPNHENNYIDNPHFAADAALLLQLLGWDPSSITHDGKTLTEYATAGYNPVTGSVTVYNDAVSAKYLLTLHRLGVEITSEATQRYVDDANTDGSYGSSSSTSETTGWVVQLLRALEGTSAARPDQLAAAETFLRSARQPDGTWTSSGWSSATVIISAAAYTVVDDTASLEHWVAAQQETDGGWSRVATANNSDSEASMAASFILNGTSWGTITGPATDSTCTAPKIVTPPANVAAAVGSDATFTVVVSGAPEPTIVWERLEGGVWTTIDGQTDSTLTISGITAADDQTQVRAVVANAFGTVATDPAAITIETNVVPDPSLQACFNTALGVSDNAAPITATQLNGLTGTIDCSSLTLLIGGVNQKITDLTGVEHLTGITGLSLDGQSELGDLSKLAGLTQLETVDVSKTGITTVDWVSGMTVLQTLDIADNAVDDLAGLANAAALTELTAYKNQITSLAPLSGLTKLEVISAATNQITDLAALSGITTLVEVTVPGNAITTLDPLTDLDSLKTLNVRNNQITDLSPVSDLDAIEVLDADGNQIATLNGLESDTLAELNVSDNDLITLDGLDKTPNLTKVIAHENEITEISVLSDLTLLKGFFAMENQIEDLTPLAELTQLEKLMLEGNNVSDVTPLSGVTSLTSLRLSDNAITDLSPLSDLSFGAYSFAAKYQRITLPTAYVGVPVTHVDVTDMDGTVVSITLPVEATDNGDGTVTYTAAGEFESTWNASATFTGTLVQPVETKTPLVVERIDGPSRLETAIEISKAGFENGSADTVVLANARSFPDALVGAPLAVQEGGPLLLTEPGTLDDRVVDEITRVTGGTGTVIILGGTAAISSDVDIKLINDLNTNYTVERIFGPSRVETSIAVADRIHNADTALIATGRNFPDALSAGTAAAARGNAVVLLTDGPAAHPAIDAWLNDHTVESYAVGGAAVTAYPTAAALQGDTRVQTAIKVAEGLFTSPQTVTLARSDQFADALAGGVYSASLDAPLLITESDHLASEVATYLCQAKPNHVVGFGGENALSPQVLEEVKTTLESCP